MGGVSGPLGKKQKDPPSAAAGREMKRMKKLPLSSRNKGQSTPMQQQPDLLPTNLDPVNPQLPGRIPDDVLLTDFHDGDFSPSYNYQSVSCVEF